MQPPKADYRASEKEIEMKNMKKAEMVKKMNAFYTIIQWIIDRFKELGLPAANGYPSESSLNGEIKQLLKLTLEDRKLAISELEKMQEIVDNHLSENGLESWTIQEFERFANELKRLEYKRTWYNFDYGVRLRVSMGTAIKILHSFGFEIRR